MKNSSQTRRRLPEQVAEAMTTILEYLWDHEMRDFLARSRIEQEGHIFNDLLVVRQFLLGRRKAKQRKEAES